MVKKKKKRMHKIKIEYKLLLNEHPKKTIERIIAFANCNRVPTFFLFSVFTAFLILKKKKKKRVNLKFQN